jgi:hypothetical protein
MLPRFIWSQIVAHGRTDAGFFAQLFIDARFFLFIPMIRKGLAHYWRA